MCKGLHECTKSGLDSKRHGYFTHARGPSRVQGVGMALVISASRSFPRNARAPLRESPQTKGGWSVMLEAGHPPRTADERQEGAAADLLADDR